jgi:sarcosine oxidase subunit beta
MAQLVDACEKGRDHDREPLQAALPYTGLTLDMGFFSHNRTVNTDSSFGVNG